jgi:HKD family nuclease
MANFSLIRPIDQPIGNRRLIKDLYLSLTNPDFSRFRVIVAYAKSGPLYRLQETIKKWTSSGKTIEAIFGIDQAGTSHDALDLSIELFDNVYVTREPGITFHPKIYLFYGNGVARVFLGSNNLTVGGTETNFESAICIDMSIPEDQEIFDCFESAWNDLLPDNCPATSHLDRKLLSELLASDTILSEHQMQRKNGMASANKTQPPRSGLAVKPQSPLPKSVLVDPKKNKSKKPLKKGSQKRLATAKSLAIQIKPHHNGEIFLSVTAALQNPGFFNWPFNGLTTPKKPGNPSYPQLDPDPVVNITVLGSGKCPILTLSRYGLNTVYYEKKSEIRITASPLVDVVPDYSVMVMKIGDESDIDYDITIYTPSSEDYKNWISVCNQKMPGGGALARRYGWF